MTWSFPSKASVLVAACVVLELLVLLSPERSGNERWLRRTRTTEVAGATTVSQSFHVHGSNFRGVKLHAYAGQAGAAGTVHFSLAEIRGDTGRPLRALAEVDVPANDVVQPGYAFRFDPIPSSSDKYYRLSMALPETARGHGLVLAMTRGDDGDDLPNAFEFGGRPRFGSLRFSVEADDPTILQRAVAHLADGPFGVGRIALAILLWVAFHIVAGYVILLARSITDSLGLDVTASVVDGHGR